MEYNPNIEVLNDKTNRSYTAEFKQEPVALLTEQGYSVSKAAAYLGIQISYFITRKPSLNQSNQVPI